MNLFKAFKITVISAAVLGSAVSLPWAFCDSAVEQYAIFGCAGRGFFAPVPVPFTPADVKGVFWQIGFGSTGPTLTGSGKAAGPRDTGAGTDGTGVEALTKFNGNDNGIRPVDVLDAAAVFPTVGFPPGSVCLGSNNWGNAGVDGCADNPRPGVYFFYHNVYFPYGSYNYPGDDNILNPYQATYFYNIGYPGYYSRGSMMDYPTAALLTVPDANGNSPWFAIAAVTNQDRNNNGDLKGPCAYYPGTNPAACDIKQGAYDFRDVSNGNPNPITGQLNVVPWQQTPRPRVACVAGCTGTGVRTVQLTLPAARIYHDGRSVRTNNPTMDAFDPGIADDPTRAKGVGVVDLLRQWGGLIRYNLQAASVDPNNLDPNGNVDYTTLSWGPLLDPNGAPLVGLRPPLDANGEPTGPISRLLDVPADTCLRASVHFGKVPEITDPTQTNAPNCRTARCGDVDYLVLSGDPFNVTCIGGALASQKIAGAALDRSKGVFELTWRTTSELDVEGFDILAVGKRGSTKVGDVSCQECTSGLPGSYSFNVSRGDLHQAGGVEGFRITMRGGDEHSVDLPVKTGGR